MRSSFLASLITFIFFKLNYGLFTILSYYQVYSIVNHYFYRSCSIKSYYRIITIILSAAQCILVAYLFSFLMDKQHGTLCSTENYIIILPFLFLFIYFYLFYYYYYYYYLGFPHSSVCKECTRNAGDPGFTPALGKCAGEGIGYPLQYSQASLLAQLVNNLPTMRETRVQSLGWRRSPGEGKGYPLQYSDLENSMDYIVHGIAKSRTRLNNFHFFF